MWNIFAISNSVDSSEADSYGWISKLLNDFNSTLTSQYGTVGCIPQGQLKTRQGYKAPDFINYLCTAHIRANASIYHTSQRTLGPWWEVKKWPKLGHEDTTKLFEYSFRANFAQLQVQALTALEESKLEVLNSIFSGGDYFAIFQWIKPGLDKKTEWVWGQEDLIKLEESIENNIQNYKLTPNYKQLMCKLKETPNDRDLIEKKEDYEYTLEDMRNMNPNILYFGEKIFEVNLDGSLSNFTPRFLHGLYWAYTLPHFHIGFESSIFTPSGKIEDYPPHYMVSYSDTILYHS